MQLPPYKILISSRQIKEKEGQNKFAEVVMNCLFKERVFPSIIIILMNNHNISMDFRVVKKNIEKNSKIKKNIKNQTVPFSENSKSFYQKHEPIKEILIYKIERKPHEHEYDLLSTIFLSNLTIIYLGFITKSSTKFLSSSLIFILNPRTSPHFSLQL